MRRFAAFLVLALLGLAGCTQAPAPGEGSAGTTIPADLMMDGAEVVARTEGVVTFRWQGVAARGTYAGPPMPPLVSTAAKLPVPAGVPLILSVTLQWDDPSADLDLRVAAADGATACENVEGSGPTGNDGNETCAARVPAPLAARETWSALVATSFAADDTPFELLVTLARLEPADAEAPARFAAPVLVGGGGHGETSLTIGPDGSMLACTHGFFREPSPLWASEDGGASWRALDPQPDPAPSGDCDVAITDDGLWAIVYDTVASATVATTRDRGATWTIMPISALPVGGVDRPWILADGSDLLLTYTDLASGLPSVQFFARSTDGGLTWTHTPMARVSDPEKPNKIPGHLFLHGDDIIVPMASLNARVRGPQDLGLLRSSDGGATWREEVLLADVEAPFQFPTAASAPDGTLYFALTRGEQDAAEVAVLWSFDDGATWSEPLVVASSYAFPGVGSAWIDRRLDGSATIAWMHAEGEAWRTSVARVDARSGTVAFFGPVTQPYASASNEFIMVRHDALGRARVLTHASDASCESGVGPLATRECILLVSEL